MTYRVVQWATGAMGRACLLGALDRPGLEVVGAFVSNPAKLGRDVGELVRRPPIGVLCSGSIEAIEALDADVVIHAARLAGTYEGHDDAIVRLLRSGKNVISINGNTFPPHWSPERRSRVDRACVDGGSSFMGAGLNPGFVADQLAAVASVVCLDLRRVLISELVMCNEMRSAEYVFELLGFGSSPGECDPNSDSWGPAVTLNSMFEEVVASLADRLGLTLDDIVRAHRMRVTDHDLVVGAGTISAGTVSQLDWCWSGTAGGTTVIELRIAWAMDDSHIGRRAPETWQIRIDGTPSVNLSFGLELPEQLAARTSVEQLGVAGTVLNAIPFVVEAPPGAITCPPPAPWRHPDAPWPADRQ
jgi:hypothetical protein